MDAYHRPKYEPPSATGRDVTGFQKFGHFENVVLRFCSENELAILSFQSIDCAPIVD
jgi:hypothetical protein